MSNEENFELVRRFNAVFRTRDFAVLDDIVAPDFVAHNGDQEVRGAAGWRQFVLETTEQAGDVDTGVDELLGDGNLVAERWWFRAAHAGSEGLSGHGITVHRLANGKLAENWAIFQPDDDSKRAGWDAS